MHFHNPSMKYYAVQWTSVKYISNHSLVPGKPSCYIMSHTRSYICSHFPLIIINQESYYCHAAEMLRKEQVKFVWSIDKWAIDHNKSPAFSSLEGTTEQLSWININHTAAFCCCCCSCSLYPQDDSSSSSSKIASL